jgi:murein DD-endopeptidase
VYAIGDGKVLHAGRYFGYGNLIVIGHNNNVFSAYGHLKKMLVKPGSKVKQGDLIGLVGRTGRATGPHLHFEISVGTKSVDPRTLLPSLTKK